ncbi:MAG TPA: methyltransferase [Micromonosporaceae bacterium]|nr:methyltransferase [Micromonosporaceae bacterium]
MTARLIVRCAHGVEWLCADEIANRFPAAELITLARRELTFELPQAGPGCLELATADDAFLEVGRVEGAGTTKDALPVVARRLAALPWRRSIDAVRRLRPVPDGPTFDVVASLEGRRSYNRFAVENTFGSILARLLGGTCLARTAAGREPGEPDLTIRVFIREQSATAAIRLGAHPLHRRRYKQETGPGTLHAPVAAALARLAAPGPGRPVLDPFCGDGTIMIETGLAYPQAVLTASDADPARVASAESNSRRAGVRVALRVGDAGLVAPADGPFASIVTNPPWNLAVDATRSLAGSLDPFWRRVPDLLAPDGRLVVLTEAALEVPAALRRAGFTLALATRIRLAGRVAQIVLAAPPGRQPAAIPQGAARWRERAIAAGVVTRDGF